MKSVDVASWDEVDGEIITEVLMIDGSSDSGLGLLEEANLAWIEKQSEGEDSEIIEEQIKAIDIRFAKDMNDGVIGWGLFDYRHIFIMAVGKKNIQVLEEIILESIEEDYSNEELITVIKSL